MAVVERKQGPQAEQGSCDPSEGGPPEEMSLLPRLHPPGVKGMEPMRPRTNSRVPCRAAMGRRASASRSAASCFDVNSRPKQAAGNSEELAM